MNVLWRSLARMLAKLIFLLSVAGCFGTLAYASEGIITTVAGSGTAGFSGDNGLAVNAQFNAPTSVALDSANNLYVADTGNHRIRKIDTKGIISTIVGSGKYGGNKSTLYGDSQEGVSATVAELNEPNGLYVDKTGNIYIADEQNGRIRKVDIAGTISTVAGTGLPAFNGDGILATTARMKPSDVTTDSMGNIYIADRYNHRIRKVNISDGKVSTIAGNGKIGNSNNGDLATESKLSYPSGIAFDGNENLYIVNNSDFSQIDRVDTTGVISTIAGGGNKFKSPNGDGGLAVQATFNNPSKIAIDDNGNFYIADPSVNCIRKIDTTGIISTVAGNGQKGFSGDGGVATVAQLNHPTGIAVDSSGNLYIADSSNNRIRKVTFSNDIPPPNPTKNLPTLGSGKAINNTGFTDTAATFTGGASVDGANYQGSLQIAPASSVNIQGRISVNPADVGKKADLLHVIGIEDAAPFDGGSDTTYFSLSDAKNYTPVNLYAEPNVWMAQLATLPFKQGVTLQSDMLVDIGQWQAPDKSHFSYHFLGYRLQDGTLVYGGVPIIIGTTTGSGNSKPSFPNYPSQLYVSYLTPIDTTNIPKFDTDSMTTLNTELNNSVVATVAGDAGGNIHFIGDKDLGGLAETIHGACIITSTGTEMIVVLDSLYRPLRLSSGNGKIVYFDWDNQMVSEYDGTFSCDQLKNNDPTIRSSTKNKLRMTGTVGNSSGLAGCKETANIFSDIAAGFGWLAGLSGVGTVATVGAPPAAITFTAVAVVLTTFSGGAWAISNKLYQDCDARTKRCNANIPHSGGVGQQSYYFLLGRAYGPITLSYQFHDRPDSIVVRYKGSILYDTGCSSGNGSTPINFSGDSDDIEVIVTGDCNNTGSTGWDFNVSCPH